MKGCGSNPVLKQLLVASGILNDVPTITAKVILQIRGSFFDISLA